MIRSENKHDAAAVGDVLLAAFPSTAEADLVERLRDAGRLTLSLVAEVDNRIVGHIAFSPVTLDDSAAVRGVGLAPLAVHPGSQGQGIAGQLVGTGIDACRERGEAFIVVLGDPAYYARFGFQAASAFGLGNEYGVDEPFMVLELQPGALASCGGMVRYSPEFAGLA